MAIARHIIISSAAEVLHMNEYYRCYCCRRRCHLLSNNEERFYSSLSLRVSLIKKKVRFAVVSRME